MDENAVARLEAKTDHIQSDVTDLKADARRLDAKIDSKCGALEAKFNELKDSMVALHLELKDEFAAIRKQQWIDKVWWLLIAGAILGVMARGMKWI
jgi:hypothetical protein